MRVLVIQTAFLGDVVLTTPLLDTLRTQKPDAEIDIVVTPAGAQALDRHPSIRTLLVYDKKGRQKGFFGFISLVRTLRRNRYSMALIPHRSMRSGMLAYFAGVPRRIGFDRSAARRWMTDVIEYRSQDHEIDRNLALLRPLGIGSPSLRFPSLRPQRSDREAASALIRESGIAPGTFVAIAPGSVWNTKRWPWERYAELVRLFEHRGYPVVLVGGPDDADLCRRVLSAAEVRQSVSAAGRLTVLQSAALMGESRALVTNDSAPLHLASAMGIPVIAIFGATSPSYGFGPRGPKDRIVETMGLSCRPCAIHGGDTCPVGTFECMLRIDAEQVAAHVLGVIADPLHR